MEERYMVRDACIHSLKGAVEPVKVLCYRSVNDVVVKTCRGDVVTAVDNIFSGYIYADDVYGIIRHEEPDEELMKLMKEG